MTRTTVRKEKLLDTPPFFVYDNQAGDSYGENFGTDAAL